MSVFMNYSELPVFSKFIDKELHICPFCGHTANWSFGKKIGFFKNKFFYKCSYCQSVIYLEASHLPTKNRNFYVFDNKSTNNTLEVGKKYNINELNKIADNLLTHLYSEILRAKEAESNEHKSPSEHKAVKRNTIQEKVKGLIHYIDFDDILMLNEAGNNEYKPPLGYEIVGWNTTCTKVRGCSYYIDGEFEIDDCDSVIVIHEPNQKYPELCNVYIDDEKVGTIKKDMAIDYVKKYGEKFCFTGHVIEYEADDLYPSIIIEIYKPVLRKIT